MSAFAAAIPAVFARHSSAVQEYLPVPPAGAVPAIGRGGFAPRERAGGAPVGSPGRTGISVGAERPDRPPRR